MIPALLYARNEERTGPAPAGIRLSRSRRAPDRYPVRPERQVEEGESHDSIFTVRIAPTKVHVHGLDDVFGTDTFAFGTLASNQTPVFGLPGNPVSALVSYELFVRPALRAMAGYRVLDRPRLSATAETDLGRRRDGKLHLLRVLAQTGDDGTLRVRLSGGQDSHMLFAMAEANALALLPDGDGVAAGGRVDVLLLDTERLGPGGEEGPW